MAQVQIETAFVDKVISGQQGPFALKTSEPHRRKNDRGEYETVGRTFRDVKGRDVDFSQFAEGDRVRIFGREVTEKREHEGKDYYSLVVWADAVVKIQPRDAAQQAQGAPNAGGTGNYAAAPTNDAQTGGWGADPTPF
ncbi:hypothetical protein [Microbacterium gubbeenense]|uniref:hypothetical protein n=1 Tax=Microbacterium gubbeenense TaxID=159896 RepID=UPI003F97E306